MKFVIVKTILIVATTLGISTLAFASGPYTISCEAPYTQNGTTAKLTFTAAFNSPYLPNGLASVTATIVSGGKSSQLFQGSANVDFHQEGKFSIYSLTDVSANLPVASLAMNPDLKGKGVYLVGGTKTLMPSCMLNPNGSDY